MKNVLIAVLAAIAVVLAVVMTVMLLSPSLNKIIVVAETWRPYEVLENGTATGIHIEMLRVAAKQLGIELDFRALPWDQCLSNVREGKADAILSLSKTPEREKFLVYPEEGFNVEETVLFIPKGSSFRWSGKLSELKNVKLGIQKDYWYGEDFEKAGLMSNDQSGTTEELISKVIGGKVTAGIATRIVTIDTLRRMGKAGQIEFLEPPLQADTIYVAFSRTSSGGKAAKLAPRFSKALQDYKKEPEYQTILKRYGLGPVTGIR